ncbi:MAG: hypothetical protein F2704_04245 [Actinobacteria bacterium]|uniref:Unannotated protein n=1 Tax=freshwater metagenome TaxID=449393 RepID=A0A6J7IGI0_9ZZZZ|nr:hypothetical protein [Actinomycetota bacterium]MSX25464.1 hypothetical protein [Actinomycetota bacterium]MSY46123.1 hypothetical protein [Actinomycetota bacterium]MSY57464.1 hypothetical protein [Actinomycetota bacterium]MTB00971.1 hypothetical protein [Actinomycetota bacterium]
MKALLVLLGASIGAPVRFIVDQYLRKFTKFPLGILLVNVVGSFIIGLLIGPADNLHIFLLVGFAGGFTTWSTFILDLYLAMELKKYKSGLLNLFLSTTLGLGAVWLGHYIGS